MNNQPGGVAAIMGASGASDGSSNLPRATNVAWAGQRSKTRFARVDVILPPKPKPTKLAKRITNFRLEPPL